MDPLSVLREYTIQHALNRVSIHGDECVFEGSPYRFPKSIPTAYRSRAGHLYSLESLLLFVRSVSSKHTEYMQAARAAKLQIVTFTDRKPLQEYLEGKVSSSDAIEVLAPPVADTALAGMMMSGGSVGVSIGGKRWEVDKEEVDVAAAAERKKLRGDDIIDDIAMADAGDEGVTAATKSSMANHIPGLSDVMQRVLAREKFVRDSHGLLMCVNKKDAFENVLTLLAERREEEKKLQRKHHRHRHQEGQRESVIVDTVAELGINPYGLHVQDMISEKDSRALKGKSEAQQPILAVGSSQARLSHGQSQLRNHHNLHQKLSSKLPSKGPPIILVPNASSTLINTYNIKEFLEDGAFVAPEVKAKCVPKKPEFVVLERRMGRERPVTYHVYDKPNTLSRKDWDRVVAVFVLGKEWQFKDWPFKDHVEILNQFLGMFVRYDDSSIESAAAVRQWNVNFLSISKHKRHQDKTAALEFWDKLDMFLRARKSTLRF